MADDKIVHLINHISVLNALLTKEKAEKAKFERKYNRYYHLVGDFYEYLQQIGKVKEFTLFHEEKEITREERFDG